MRTAVFADIAGHLNSFIWHAENLGCSFYEDEEEVIRAILPQDLNLVFAGDLVHRGPDSEELLYLIERLRQDHPAQVFTIIGNHEGNYIKQNPYPFRWHQVLSLKAQAMLQNWWDSNLLLPALGVTSTMGPLLITHAGVTQNFWKTLNKPVTVQDAFTRLMDMKLNDDKRLWATGVMAGGNSKYVGPIWASANSELYPSWLGVENAPFGQIHGHSTCFLWDSNRFFNHRTINPEIPTRTLLLRNKRISVTTLGGKPFFSCDPSHDNKPVDNLQWQPLLLEKSRILTRM